MKRNVRINFLYPAVKKFLHSLHWRDRILYKPFKGCYQSVQDEINESIPFDAKIISIRFSIKIFYEIMPI